MIDHIFMSIVTIQTIGILGLIWSIVRPHQRTWPPPGKWTWPFLLHWGVAGLCAAGFFAIGISQWSGFGFHTIIAVTMIITSLMLGRRSVKALSLAATVGLKKSLITTGPYTWSRNPMYIADITHVLGWTLFFNNAYTWLIAIPWCTWFLLAPLAEEPWLKEQYGKPYEDYLKAVPRFL